MYDTVALWNHNKTSRRNFNSWNGSYVSPISQTWTISIGIYLIVLGVLTFLLNSLIVLTFMCRWRKRKTPVEWCVINLAITGIVPATMSYPIYAMSCFNGGWFLGYSACLFDGVVVFFFGMVSISTLLVIAVLRLINTVKPRLKLPSTGLLLLMTYIYAAVWSFSPLFGWGNYDIEPSQLTCSLTWYTLSTSYFVALVFFGYFVPIVIIGFCYFQIWLYVKDSTRDQYFATVCARKRVSLTKVTFYTCVAFFFAWTPYTAFSMAAFHEREAITSPQISVLPGMFAKLSWLYNPLIYFFMVKRFRQSAVATVLCREMPTLDNRSLLQMTPKRATRSSNDMVKRDLAGRGSPSGSDCENKVKALVQVVHDAHEYDAKQYQLENL